MGLDEKGVFSQPGMNSSSLPGLADEGAVKKKETQHDPTSTNHVS